MDLRALANPPPVVVGMFDAQTVRYVVCGGLMALTCALVVLAWTQWGQSNPLRKCIVLSLLAHLLAGIYLTTVQIVAGRPHGGDGASIVLVDDAGAESGEVDGSPGAADDRASEAAQGETAPPKATEDRAAPDKPVPAADSAPTASDKPSPAQATPSPPAAPVVATTDSTGQPAPTRSPEPTADAAAKPPEATPPVAKSASRVAEHQDIPPPDPRAASSDEPSPGSAAVAKPGANPSDDPLAGPATSSKPTPEIYVLRTAGDHVRVAESHGGSEQTEAAVGAALIYLVANQSIDGRWNPRALEAGRQSRVDGAGPDRQGVGLQADTGITGLCLLSLLAAGHTHLQGRYSTTVRHGLEFLLGAQAPDGNLCGAATLYERMYCHGMATFALSEALAMTGDDRLQPAVRAAVGYTLRAQRPGVGGWRYQPGEAGDMSQFGWQAMALKSAALGGVTIPEESRAAMRQFLQSVSSGAHAGLASYRPGHQPTRTMTAEALVCRQFIGLAADHPQSLEAADFLIAELPGSGPANVYYWYYGTLATYQMQGVYWERWNAALQKQLLGAQRRDGKLAGSWDPDPVWGGYGGRAFSTALSTLCLEVYYRFLPLYAAHAETGRKTR